MTLDYRSMGYLIWSPGNGNIFFTGLFLLLLHLVPSARMTTVGAQRWCSGNRVTKVPGNSSKHLIQMFHYRMEEWCSAAKWSTNNQYVCKYVGHITDQSYCPDLLALWLWCSITDPEVPGSIPGPGGGRSTGIFSLQINFSSYYASITFFPCYTAGYKHDEL